MKDLEEITVEQAIAKATSGEEVYMMKRLFGDATIDEVSWAEAFYGPKTLPAEPGPPKGVIVEKAKKTIDHGRIVALYTANPPRTIKWIAEDMGITQQTVINHLKKEGIYKNEDNS